MTSLRSITLLITLIAAVTSLPRLACAEPPQPILEFKFNETGTVTPNTGTAIIATPGDYDRDGEVGASDYVLWRDTYDPSAAVGPGKAADGNNNGLVDDPDYGVWMSNFGAAAGTGSLPMTKWDGSTWITNDNHGTASSGLTGTESDRSYHDTSTILGTAQTPGTSNAHYYGGYAGGLNVEAAQTMTALTATGWFKVAAGKPLGTDGTAQTLLGNLGNSSNDGGWAIRSRGTSTAGAMEFRFGKDDFTANHISVFAPNGTYSETDEWVFFAVSLDAANNGNWQFFKGTTASAVTSVASGMTGALIGGALTYSNRNFYIGNLASEGAEWFQARAFNGQLDNMRVFNSVLTIEDLETVRMTDLMAAGSGGGLSAIQTPEPASLTLCALIVVIASARRTRK
jgi:hypothetical protein